jgi:hypothetical protein
MFSGMRGAERGHGWWWTPSLCSYGIVEIIEKIKIPSLFNNFLTPKPSRFLIFVSILKKWMINLHQYGHKYHANPINFTYYDLTYVLVIIFFVGVNL